MAMAVRLGTPNLLAAGRKESVTWLSDGLHALWQRHRDIMMITNIYERFLCVGKPVERTDCPIQMKADTRVENSSWFRLVEPYLRR